MQVLALSFLFLAGCAVTVAKAQSSTEAPEHVKAYKTKKGKQVKAHERSSPNATEKDNYSAKGNVNPYTGKKGSKKPKH
jgi:heat shock protein HslJ